MALSRDLALTKAQIRAHLAKAFLVQARDTVYDKVCEIIDSYSFKNEFAALGAPPQLKEVDDGETMTFEEIIEYTYDYENRLFQAGISIDKSALEGDQTRQLISLPRSLAQTAANFPDKLLSDRLRNGTDATLGLCPTGSAFFSASHALGQDAPAAQSNLQTGSTPASMYDPSSGVPLDSIAIRLAKDLSAAAKLIRSWTANNGMPLRQTVPARNLIVICSPLITDAMRHAVAGKFLQMSDNQMQGSVGAIYELNFLPNSGSEGADWYLFDVGGPNRALGWSRMRQRRDEELLDKLPMVQSALGVSGGMDGPAGSALKSFDSLIVEDTFGRVGSSADAYTMANRKFLVSATLRGELLYQWPFYCTKVENAAA